ncbi:hypothetical protein ACTQ56_12920 [[Clostridium] aminophilum]|uniref:hypothetical protein n=1 Tax=[Clostridium] aminophilum TaxID=1526 RepID=UPI00303282E4|nr:hypothetical protein [[Clostridium] aminophilum]
MMTNYDKLMEQMSLRKLAELLVTPVQYEKDEPAAEKNGSYRENVQYTFKSILGNTYDTCAQAVIENVAYLKMDGSNMYDALVKEV